MSHADYITVTFHTCQQEHSIMEAVNKIGAAKASKKYGRKKIMNALAVIRGALGRI